MTYHYVNDGPVNFTLDDRTIELYLHDHQLNFTLTNEEVKMYLNDGIISFKLKTKTPVTVLYRLLEDGGRRLNEDGTFRILE